MEDKKSELIHNCEIKLAFISPDIREQIMNMLINEINNYEVIEKCTDIVPVDDNNIKIIKRYLACLTIDGKSEKTIKAYQRCLYRFNEFCGKPINEIGAYDIRFYLVKKKQDGNSNSTLETTRAYLSAFFSWAFNEEIIPKNPMSTIKPIKVEQKIKEAFNSVEIDSIRSACTNTKERAIIELLLSSGVRVEELSNLNVSDINFNSCEIHVRNGKGGKDRTTYMNDVAKKHLEAYLLNRKEDGDILFYNKNHGRMQTGGFRWILRKIGKNAEVENVHPHRFRRTLATNLAHKGMSIQDIQHIMGHSNIKTTMVYVCINEESVHNDYKKFNN